MSWISGHLGGSSQYVRISGSWNMVIVRLWDPFQNGRTSWLINGGDPNYLHLGLADPKFPEFWDATKARFKSFSSICLKNIYLFSTHSSVHQVKKLSHLEPLPAMIGEESIPNQNRFVCHSLNGSIEFTFCFVCFFGEGWIQNSKKKTFIWKKNPLPCDPCCFKKFSPRTCFPRRLAPNRSL